jgi:hypothetical protein
LGLHLGDSNRIRFGPPLDLDALADLVGLHVILQAWSYAWRPCPHHVAYLKHRSIYHAKIAKKATPSAT